MSEFGKIHRKFWEHNKVQKCSNGAIGLWAKANAWCRDQRSAGYVPRVVAEDLGNRSEIDELVAARLWTAELRGGLYVGFRFNDYAHWNDDVEPETEAGNLVRQVVPAEQPSAIRKQLVRQVAALLSEGISQEVVARALALWLAKGLSPSLLPALVSEAMAEARRAATLRNTIDECIKCGVVSPLKAFGHVFTPPDPPDGLDVQSRREFMNVEKLKWLNALRVKVA